MLSSCPIVKIEYQNCFTIGAWNQLGLDPSLNLKFTRFLRFSVRANDSDATRSFARSSLIVHAQNRWTNAHRFQGSAWTTTWCRYVHTYLVYFSTYHVHYLGTWDQSTSVPSSRDKVAKIFGAVIHFRPKSFPPHGPFWSLIIRSPTYAVTHTHICNSRIHISQHTHPLTHPLALPFPTYVHLHIHYMHTCTVHCKSNSVTLVPDPS